MRKSLPEIKPPSGGLSQRVVRRGTDRIVKELQRLDDWRVAITPKRSPPEEDTDGGLA
jgi:hypothetical protein